MLQRIFCRPHIYPVHMDVDLNALSERVAQKKFPAILGANPSVEGWSIFAAEPAEVFVFWSPEERPFEKLLSILSKYRLCSDAAALPAGVFCGGWIGFFGYELGRFIEALPGKAADDLEIPVIRLAFYDKAILHHHASHESFLMALDCQPQRQTVQEKMASLKTWLGEAETAGLMCPDGAGMEQVHMEAFDCNMTRAQYMDAIARTKCCIAEGDTYQINFSQRFATDFYGQPADLFQRLNRRNPSPYAAYLAWEDGAAVSASPELFLNVSGQTIVTKPIKGTRPRDPRLPDEAFPNRRHFNDLVQSEKDQAELAMIVDLERNDLARLCVPGTRQVTCARAIEAFPTVYHAVATVEGQLASPPEPQRVIDILKAAFPGGSITGAPKIRSMEIIDELEPTARGIYTGSIGWIGINFDLCWNIAIRTAVIRRQKAYVQVGGGIVADSDPQVEWEETLTKAYALLEAVNAVNTAVRQRPNNRSCSSLHRR
ncbi:MAG: anthranilate synthase component I family protein [Planctomycetales bacterium]|nr:anthranilate synthase component I family protein [Planctomycetales bacterium]